MFIPCTLSLKLPSALNELGLPLPVNITYWDCDNAYFAIQDPVYARYLVLVLAVQPVVAPLRSQLVSRLDHSLSVNALETNCGAAA